MIVTLAGRPAAVDDEPRTVRSTPSIEPLKVVDAQGRTWTRLPAAWVEQSKLCDAVKVYDHGGAAYIVRCREKSSWTCDGLAYCGLHFRGLLDFEGREG